jgi:DNA-binding NarL/FixJ family response regulator
VVAEASSPEELLAAVEEHEPDVAIVDIRMPPTQTDEGLQAAHEIRRRHPAMGIVLLSQHVEVGVATQLLAESPQHLGYLLKDRVADPADFAGALRRVADGGTAIDPQVVSGLLSDPKEAGPLGSLSARERSVLELVAEGRSNKAIGEQAGDHPELCAKAREHDLQQARPSRGRERRPPDPRRARVPARRAPQPLSGGGCGCPYAGGERPNPETLGSAIERSGGGRQYAAHEPDRHPHHPRGGRAQHAPGPSRTSLQLRTLS